MNLLTEKSPGYIMVGGRKITINTGFEIWVKLLLACEKNDSVGIFEAITEIYGTVPENCEEFVKACIDWMMPDKESEKKQQSGSSFSAHIPFDFDTDGSVIYCELWQYFPQLMQKGISFHEGLELIKILLHNEHTVLWHRAFARCGDFSKMDKEQQKYWNSQRAIYRIEDKHVSQEDRDRWLYNAF